MDQPAYLRLFSYEGPAIIGGVHFDEVSLHEDSDPFGVRPAASWRGRAVVPFTAWTPPHFGLPDTPTLTVELPDGRRGEICASVEFVEQRWTLNVLGVGPVPA